MEPIVAPLVPDVCLGLRDLVGVMREGVVDAAAVNVQIFAQMLHADAGAFDVPAGIANSPRAVPFQLLVVKFGFGEPKNKVGFVSLVVIRLHALTDSDFQIFLLKVVEHVILL